MKRLVKYFKPYLLSFFVLLFLVFGQSFVNLALPGYTSRIVDEGIVLKNINIVWSLGIKMLLLTLMGGLFAAGVGYLAAKISTGYARRLREAVFTKVESFSLNEFNTFSSSSLVTRATNDIQQVQGVLSMLMRLTILAPFLGIGAIIKAHQIAPSMTWITFSSVCILAVMIVILFLVAIPKFTLIQKIVDKLGLQIKEMLVGVRVIRAYNKDSDEQIKFAKTNLESTSLNVFVNRLMNMMQPVMTLVMGVASLMVIWVGAYMINDNKLQVGNVLALTQYVSQTIFAFLMISIIFIMVPRAAVSGRRLNEILNTVAEIKDPEQPLHLPHPVKGLVEFREVCFSYEGSERPVLSNISFTAKPGEITAIIGGTGSGKSTLLNLIPRLYDVSCGSLLIDGVDIRKLTQHELRENIGYIPQRSSLFSGTIKSNIAYGKTSASDEEISQAASLAQASEFINTLKKKTNSEVSQGGSNISGGQKQRLSIARALVKMPPIFLFDDSFSALDYKTDADLRQAIKLNLKHSTIIIVAQRISTIMQADNIIVLDNGVIVGSGRHRELLKNSKVYREIAESQLSAAELKNK